MKPRLGVWQTVKTLFWRAHPGGKTQPLCAASGLVRAPGGFWAVADDLHHLIELRDGRAHGLGHRLFAGEPPSDAARRKKVKKDFEALLDLGEGRLVAFPSGSKGRRCLGSLVVLDARGRAGRPRVLDFRPLMELLEAEIRGLNIEGGFVAGKKLVLLQRGNGRHGVNAVVKLKLKGFLAGLEQRWRPSKLGLTVKRVDLGRWKGVPLSFTDGFFHDGTAYVCAAAEASEDAYHDGPIIGSVVCAMPKGRRPVVLARLAGTKIEGLALKEERSGRLRVYAVTDDDDPGRPSRLLRAWIAKV